MSTINKYIEDYIEYYLSSTFNPDFAVLLQGKWGCGKTWFIKEFIRKNSNKYKFLYITLYGVSSFSEIDDQIFQQLHPVLSSKPMALTGKILKGVARSSLKIDFDDGKKSIFSVNTELPKIKLPEFLKNTEGRIIVFDDLERCDLKLTNLLGYINSLVEHQRLKVILLANEDELRIIEEKNGKDLYGKIKEKLIGKTLRVGHDVDSAFESFVTQIEEGRIRTFLNGKKEEIVDIFNTAGYCNLRHLKQSLWDFERFYKSIPSKYQSIDGLMDELLRLFLAFSFEIKKGEIGASDFNSPGFDSSWEIASAGIKGDKEDLPIFKIGKKYPFVNLYDIILPHESWSRLFDKGYITSAEITESLDNSRYCWSNETPAWVRLWHVRELEDDEYVKALSEVTDQWERREFKRRGEILHVCGLLLSLSKMGLISQSITDASADCKRYITDIKNSGNLYKHSEDEKLKNKRDFSSGLEYAAHGIKEFEEISEYLDKLIYESKIESLPEAGKKLLEIVSKDSGEFRKMISFENEDYLIYKETPVFKFVKPEDFFNIFVKLNFNEKRRVILAMKHRYKMSRVYPHLYDEIDFLKNFNSLVLKGAEDRTGKVSGYILKEFSNGSITKMIDEIEKTKIV